jgi:glycosyltransferase involved in cell wall biosynthesis
MKVLACNKFYYIIGGADSYFLSLGRLLKQNGHEVIPFSIRDKRNCATSYEKFFINNYLNKDDRKIFWQIKAGLNSIYSLEAKRNLEKLLKIERPDVVHIQNIYHHISPSILPLIKKYNLPVIFRVADYKLICPNYSLFDGEKTCELCKKIKYYNCVVKRCFKGSLLYSLYFTLEAYLHKITKIFEKNIDAFIAPSLFLKNKLIEFGIDSKKIYVLHNFIQLDNCEPSFTSQNYFVYVGRLEKTKGVDILLKAIKKSELMQRYELKIIGEGKEKNRLTQYCIKNNIKNVKFYGYLFHEQIREIIKHSIMAVVPSVCYDVSPNVILESFAMGKPVIASRIGGIPEFIIDNKDGLLCNPGDTSDLKEKIEYLLAHPNEAVAMGKEGRNKVEDFFNPSRHLEGLLDIYRKVGVEC